MIERPRGYEITTLRIIRSHHNVKEDEDKLIEILWTSSMRTNDCINKKQVNAS